MNGKRQRTRRLPMAEMNVVPYIDVMLVLLVIFMITAPLLAQGVKVNLPQTASEPLPQEKKEPVIVTVDVNGAYYLNVGEKHDQAIAADALVQIVAAVLRRQPETPILVRGDESVNYGKVVEALSLLQGAGAPNVGLVTESPTPAVPKKR
ncbi:MAG: protein TolR [Gammaproteobacteria bacterium]